MQEWVRRRRFLLTAVLLPVVAVSGWAVHRGVSVSGSSDAPFVAGAGAGSGVAGSAVVPGVGHGGFTYGASVLVKPDETSKGANVIQKWFSVSDSQFKLQVDDEDGYPSCVIVGTRGPAIYVALASRSVADGRWHRIACARSNALLTVAVDGSVSGRAAIPSSLSIVNADPLCIGGKGTSANNDQFVGAIDDVSVTRVA